PTVGDALEFVLACIVEGQARTDDEILHGPRDEDLPWPGQRSYACPDDDRETTHIVAYPFALSGMDAGSDVEPESRDSLRQCPRAAGGAHRSVEDGEERVSGRL